MEEVGNFFLKKMSETYHMSLTSLLTKLLTASYSTTYSRSGANHMCILKISTELFKQDIFQN
jgi:hypothetical protein